LFDLFLARKKGLHLRPQMKKEGVNHGDSIILKRTELGQKVRREMGASGRKKGEVPAVGKEYKEGRWAGKRRRGDGGRNLYWGGREGENEVFSFERGKK